MQIGRSTLALLIIACLSPAVLPARSSGADSTFRPPDESTLRFLSRSIPEGKTARVTLRSGTRTFGSPLFTPAGVTMSRSAQSAATDSALSLRPWQEVKRIDVRGYSARRGAAGGGVVVGLFAAGLAVAVASDPVLGNRNGNNFGPIFGVTALGVMTGAGIGALVGTLIPRWKRVYPQSGREEADRARSWSSRGARRP